MPRIRILPEILANKIAAGEVVARPASVVKELVENSIDAGSTRIIVEIEQGGRKLIRVSDNGQGMGRDDALLCLERYATSKINRDPDLLAIRTLGFRGEALPSIASVSRFVLVTREANADAGTRIEVEGGRIRKVSDVGAPPGTMISVAGLFYNTPARRKFLKNIPTEMGHIADTIASMALCRPSVQFRLSHNDRIVKSWAPAADPTDRVADVLGAAIQQAWVPVDRVSGDIEISGWVAAPRVNRSTTRGIYLFVNGRWVKDRIIQHALFAGYRGRLMKGQYPVCVLFLRVPFDQVDVNVHPTKHEIRFVFQQKVHDTVQQAVADALRQTDPTQRKAPEPGGAQVAQEPSWVAEGRADYSTSRIREIDPRYALPMDAPDRPPPTESPAGNHCKSPAPGIAPKARTGQPIPQAPLWTRRFFADLVFIGQYKGTYLICESDDDLILIDQHAAHERIVFEQLKRQSDENRPATQLLLLPETIELGFGEARILKKLIPELARYGLEIDHFGGNTFVIKALPTLLDSGGLAALVTQLVEKAAEIGVNAEVKTMMDACLMVMACHHAIRAHQQLSDVQIKALFKQLDDCDNPSHCPHGRPIWVRWTGRELEKQFQRIV